MDVLPYKNRKETKKTQVSQMFDNISRHYDFLNHFLSLGIDIWWRKKAISQLKDKKPQEILDIATGTGDLAIEALKLNPKKVTGIDISKGMLEIGQKKIEAKNLTHQIELLEGDSENLHFEDAKFDAVVVAFGVRNFENLNQGLKEIFRVLKNDGQLIILEFSKPTIFPLKQLYKLYFLWILPKIGKIISKDNSAYTYLPQSVLAFPDGKEFLEILKNLNFRKLKCIPLTLGIASIYIASK